MLNLYFSVRNPFHKKNDFKSLFEKGGKIYGNKNWEVQLVRCSYYLLELDLDLCFTGKSHAGPALQIGLLGFSASVKIYDGRHWDDLNNRWERYD